MSLGMRFTLAFMTQVALWSLSPENVHCGSGQWIRCPGDVLCSPFPAPCVLNFFPGTSRWAVGAVFSILGSAILSIPFFLLSYSLFYGTSINPILLYSPSVYFPINPFVLQLPGIFQPSKSPLKHSLSISSHHLCFLPPLLVSILS